MQQPFNYKAELRKARGVLDQKVFAYLSENPQVVYREAAKRFHLSAAAVCAIVKRYSRGRTRARPVAGGIIGKVTFYMRYVVNGEESEMNLTVMVPKGTPAKRIRSAIEEYFECRELKRGGSLRTTRHAEYALNELSRSKAHKGAD